MTRVPIHIHYEIGSMVSVLTALQGTLMQTGTYPDGVVDALEARLHALEALVSRLLEALLAKEAAAVQGRWSILDIAFILQIAGKARVLIGDDMELPDPDAKPEGAE